MVNNDLRITAGELVKSLQVLSPDTVIYWLHPEAGLTFPVERFGQLDKDEEYLDDSLRDRWIIA